MKNKITLTCFLLIQILSPGRLFSQQESKIGNNLFSKLHISIDGEFIGQIPALEKKDLAGAVLFKMEGGLLQIRINGVINRDSRNGITARLYATQIKDNELDILAMINNKAVHYQIAETGFGLYKDNENPGSEFTIRTRIRITADGYPDYFLEFPVIAKITAVGNIDDMQTYISCNPDHFIFFSLTRSVNSKYL